jgi:hypothetical protein
LRPVLKPILARQDELRIGQRQPAVEDRARRLAFLSRMIGRDPCRGGNFSRRMLTKQFFCLKLKLPKIGTRGK